MSAVEKMSVNESVPSSYHIVILLPYFVQI